MKPTNLLKLNFKNSEKIGRDLLVHYSRKALKSKKLLTMSSGNLLQNSKTMECNEKISGNSKRGDRIFSVKQASTQKQFP